VVIVKFCEKEEIVALAILVVKFIKKIENTSNMGLVDEKCLFELKLANKQLKL